MDINRNFHPITAESSLFSSVHGIYTKIDHIIDHKTNFNKFKTIDIIPSVFSDHNKTKVEINNKKITEKSPNTWKLNNILLNNLWVKEGILK